MPGETYSLAELALLITKSSEKIIFKEWPEMHLKIETGSTFFENKVLNTDPIIHPEGLLESWISEMHAKEVFDV